MAGDSQTVTLTASTAATLTWTSWYPELVIANDGTGAVFARADGTAATGGNGDVNVPAGETQAIGNEQPEPEPDMYGGQQPFLVPGWTNQTNKTTYTSGSPTYVSLYSTGTPTVTVTAQ